MSQSISQSISPPAGLPSWTSLASPAEGCPLLPPAAPRLGLRALRIDAETPYSFRVSWQPVDPRNIRHYRLSYMADGERREETVRTTQYFIRGGRWVTARVWGSKVKGVEDGEDRAGPSD